MKYVTSLLALALTACGVVPPDGQCAPTAGEKAYWAGVEGSNTSAGYRKYLSDYPNGCYATTATNRLRIPVSAAEISRLAKTKAGGSVRKSGFRSY